MYCLYFMFTNYTSKYHYLCRYNNDMCIKRYVDILRIYISQVCINSSDNRYSYNVLYEKCYE